MVRIDCLIFGYRKLKISPSDLSYVTSLFIRRAIFSSISDDGTLVVRERDIAKIQALLSGRMEFSCSEPKGLYGKWLKLKYKETIIIGLLISLVMTLLLSSVVWDVRISGNENIADEEIISELKSCGFGIGDFWISKNRSRIESSFLAENKDIAWININRRGTVAYVRIIEKQSDDENKPLEKIGYSNIIATADCVIEEITVKSGTAVVKPGDVVKKGDLLVAGILPSNAGGGFCYAEAVVIGRCYDTLSVEIERIYQQKLYKGRSIEKIELNFFDFSINIFKKYGNLTNSCDIIEDEIEYTHLDRCKLPFSVSISYIPLFDFLEARYTDEEIVKLATNKLNLLTIQRLESKDLLKIKTYGEFTESGYSICSDIVFLCQVGENIDF